jgi:hypothetical protein
MCDPRDTPAKFQNIIDNEIHSHAPSWSIIHSDERPDRLTKVKAPRVALG